MSEISNPYELWSTGFPQESGQYLVELADGEMVVTFWNNGDGKNIDTWGDERKPGWCCLTHSRSTVKRWIKASALSSPQVSTPDPEIDRLKLQVEVLRDACIKIAKRPDLPNQERDADWRNCQKWSSRDAREALAAAEQIGKE